VEKRRVWEQKFAGFVVGLDVVVDASAEVARLGTSVWGHKAASIYRQGPQQHSGIPPASKHP
jgi:hypothetical protein